MAAIRQGSKRDEGQAARCAEANCGIAPAEAAAGRDGDDAWSETDRRPCPGMLRPRARGPGAVLVASPECGVHSRGRRGCAGACARAPAASGCSSRDENCDSHHNREGVYEAGCLALHGVSFRCAQGIAPAMLLLAGWAPVDHG